MSEINNVKYASKSILVLDFEGVGFCLSNLKVLVEKELFL